MIKNVLTHIGGVGAYGVISICIFFGVFLAVLIWMLTLRKDYLKTMQRLPLEDDSSAATSLNSNPTRRLPHE